MLVRNDSSLTIGWLVSSLVPPDLSATFVLKGTFQLQHEGRAATVEKPELPAGDLPYPDGPEDSLMYEADLVPWKPRADLLLVGSCHAPGGVPTRICRVSFQVGAWSKVLAAIGNRNWKRTALGWSITDPQPFLRLPLRYERAFGGPTSKENPIGIGLDDGELPNIENPSSLLRVRGDRPPAAGFGPIHRTRPQRTANMGTYDKTWQVERWPWLPKDFDWGNFNAAPRDQQVEGYLRGDESLVFENLHPQVPLFKSELPGLRPQLFYLARVEERLEPREVKLNLDTLWVDMDRGTLVLLWRGTGPVRSIKLKDVEEVHVVCGTLADPPTTWDAYQAELQKRADLRREEEAQEDSKLAQEKREEERKKLELDEEARLAEEKEAAREAEVDRVMMQEQAKAGASSAPPPSPSPQSVSLLEATIAAFFRADPAVAHSGVAIPDSEETPPEEMEEPAPLPWTRERCVDHAKVRGSFAAQDLRGLDLSGLDLSGLDFSEALLSGTNLSGSNLKTALLTGAILAKADFSRANLTSADLSGADAAKTKFDQADLSQAKLERAVLCKSSMLEARLDGCAADFADFSDADLQAATFRGSHCHNTWFSRSNVQKCDFASASLKNATFEKVKAAGIQMEGANLEGFRAGSASDFSGGVFRSTSGEGTYWEEANLDGADFRSATLPLADFEFASLRGTRLDGADLRKAKFADANLERASLLSANLFQGSLERARLLHADLRHSNLYEVEFWQAVVEGARFDGANLKMTKLASLK